MSAVKKKDIRAYSLEELQQFFTVNGDQAFRGKQVYQWLWNKGVHDFDAMTNISKSTRQFLDDHFTINHIAVDQQQRSQDGTIKNKVNLFDGRVGRVGFNSRQRPNHCMCFFSSGVQFGLFVLRDSQAKAHA